ncbi:MAG: hypothetical protein ACI8XO_004534 [Verrucomicrobiales bacterium]|jgi:hypothetical protein
MEATQAPTPCNQQTFSFQALENRRVEVDFSGGYLSSDGGSVLLREIDSKRRFTSSLAACFSDHRCTPLVEHELGHLLAQRIHAIALGYEDINDHDKLRLDPVLALSCNKADLLGEERSKVNRGKALAGKSTLNRLELGSNGLSKTKKIEPHPGRIRDFLIDEGVRCIPRRSRVITLDFDATDDPIHGGQEGRFFHGYYKSYCYLPLYCFCGDVPLWAELREANIDAAKGILKALQHIVAKIRGRFGKKVTIIVRADSGFCRDAILTWIEKQRWVHYVIGLAKNAVLKERLAPTTKPTSTRNSAKTPTNSLSSKPERRNRNSPSSPASSSTKPMPSCAIGRRRAGAVSGEWSAKPRSRRGKSIRASSSPISPARKSGREKPPPSKAGSRSTKTTTARAATWRTGSKNNRWTCSPTAPRRARWRATNCGSGSPLSHIC